MDNLTLTAYTIYVRCENINVFVRVFLVPDSCRATERNGDSIRVNVTDDTIEND
jgi:hypothetical protein